MSLKGHIEVIVGVRVIMHLPADTKAEDAYRLARELVEEHVAPTLHQADDRVSAVKFNNVTGFRVRDK